MSIKLNTPDQTPSISISIGSLALKEYKEQKWKYHKTFELTAGLGAYYGDEVITKAYEEMSDAWQKMSADEQKSNPLPPIEKCTDDGMAGFPSGLANQGRTMGEDGTCSIQ